MWGRTIQIIHTGQAARVETKNHLIILNSLRLCRPTVVCPLAHSFVNLWHVKHKYYNDRIKGEYAFARLIDE